MYTSICSHCILLRGDCNVVVVLIFVFHEAYMHFHRKPATCLLTAATISFGLVRKPIDISFHYHKHIVSEIESEQITIFEMNLSVSQSGTSLIRSLSSLFFPLFLFLSVCLSLARPPAPPAPSAPCHPPLFLFLFMCMCECVCTMQL